MGTQYGGAKVTLTCVGVPNSAGKVLRAKGRFTVVGLHLADGKQVGQRYLADTAWRISLGPGHA